MVQGTGARRQGVAEDEDPGRARLVGRRSYDKPALIHLGLLRELTQFTGVAGGI